MVTHPVVTGAAHSEDVPGFEDAATLTAAHQLVYVPGFPRPDPYTVQHWACLTESALPEDDGDERASFDGDGFPFRAHHREGFRASFQRLPRLQRLRRFECRLAFQRAATFH